MFLSDGTWDAVGEVMLYARSLAYGLPLITHNLLEGYNRSALDAGYITKYNRTRKRPKRASMNPRVFIRKANKSQKINEDQ